MSTALPELRSAILKAITSLGHEIEDERVTFFFDPKKSGHNALNQLANAVEAAIAADRAERGVPVASIKPQPDGDEPYLSRNDVRRMLDGLKASAETFGLELRTDANGSLSLATQPAPLGLCGGDAVEELKSLRSRVGNQRKEIARLIKTRDQGVKRFGIEYEVLVDGSAVSGPVKSYGEAAGEAAGHYETGKCAEVIAIRREALSWGFKDGLGKWTEREGAHLSRMAGTAPAVSGEAERAEFVRLYQIACDSSRPADWFKAALQAQRWNHALAGQASVHQPQSAEAQRRNSEYDYFGMGNTPQSIDPDAFLLAEAALREPEAPAVPLKESFEDKCARNARVQSRYDELMAEGKHGHYESMFRVVREEIERAHNIHQPSEKK